MFTRVNFSSHDTTACAAIAEDMSCGLLGDPFMRIVHARAGPEDARQSGPRHLYRPAETAQFWADVAYVPTKGDGRRVLLVGESAARGFLLDPGLTPADVLRGELSNGAEQMQCVDLAKNPPSRSRSSGSIRTKLDRMRALPTGPSRDRVKLMAIRVVVASTAVPPRIGSGPRSAVAASSSSRGRDRYFRSDAIAHARAQ
ncbi:hypothetical protein [Streptomyces griseoluteus]|uniref:hypothetical protein n=1 Tax=Streptomyces griseoluteus TaxID=29306 RepID=UPI0036F736B4